MIDHPAGPARLDGVRWGRLVRHGDSRGSFTELWRASWFAEERFVQANRSASDPGVLRGLHFHRRQLDFWVVSSGRALVALVDVRPMLDGSGGPIVETRELVADETVVIPPGVAHGFLALEPLELVYVVTNEYDGSDELGFAWDDPLAAVPWPAVAGTRGGAPILSERDRSNPSLPELVATVRARS